MANDPSHLQKRNRPLTGWLYRIKDWTEGLADHRLAVPALFILAFAESSFFPIPPDVLLIALCVGNPARSFYYALVCSVGSVLGGMAGYGIGHLLWYGPGGEYTQVARFFLGGVPGLSEAKFMSVQALFEKYNFWIVFTAGFTPIPYKLFTIAAGLFEVSFPMFVVASVVGRAGRFFLVGALFNRFGSNIKDYLERYLGVLTLAFTALLILGFVVVKMVL